MNLLQITAKNIKAKPLSSTLNLILFATGIFIISFLIVLKTQFRKQIEKNIAGVDLVVGAKGSPMQLILCSLYQVDYPTGNITLSDAEKIKQSPLVKKTIPMAMGDNYKGYRIVGTDHDYSALYQGKLSEGNLWNEDFDVTIGSKVAKEAHLKIGDQFVGVHGFMANGTDKHDAFKYTVRGIFEESGTVLDQLILTNIESVWKLHAHHHHHDGDGDGDDDEIDHDGANHEAAKGYYEAGNLSEEGHEHDDAEHEITSMLVFFRNPMGAITLPRMINKDTNMQAASPVTEMNRLYSLTGIGIRSVSLIAYLIILISAFSIFISLFNSLKERKYELALIRVLGGSKRKVFAIILLEGLSISLLGFLAGFILSRIGMVSIAAYADDNFHYSLNSFGSTGNDLLLLLTSLLLGTFASVLPAIKAMNTDISKTLSES